MDTINIALVIVGTIVILIGIAAFINPNFARIINVPGGQKLKSIVALVIGIVLIIVGLIS